MVSESSFDIRYYEPGRHKTDVSVIRHAYVPLWMQCSVDYLLVSVFPYLVGETTDLCRGAPWVPDLTADIDCSRQINEMFRQFMGTLCSEMGASIKRALDSALQTGC
jgi:hypothetical protein